MTANTRPPQPTPPPPAIVPPVAPGPRVLLTARLTRNWPPSSRFVVVPASHLDAQEES